MNCFVNFDTYSVLLKILAFTLRVAVTYEVKLLILEFPANFGSINNAEHRNNKKIYNFIFILKLMLIILTFIEKKYFY